MAASFNKSGIVAGSPIEGHDKISVYKDNIVVNPNLMVNTAFVGDFFTNTTSKTGWYKLPLSGDEVSTNVTRNGLNSIHRYRADTSATSWSELSYYDRSGALIQGETYTLSTWVYTDNADWLSVSTNTFSTAARGYDSSNVNIYGSSSSTASFGNLNLKPTKANTWEFKTATFTVPAVSSSVSAMAWWYRYFTIPRDVDVYFTEVKLEKGSVATPWCPNSLDGYGTINQITMNNPMFINEIIEY